MSEKRRDNRNRILREGEYQRTDGRYRYRYIDEDGKEKNVYSWRLDKNDPTPRGKKRELSLREKEKQIQADLFDHIVTRGGNYTVVELVEKYTSLKTGVGHNTKAGYKTVINILNREAFGKQRIDKVRLSDAKAWLIKLQQVDGRGYSSIHSIRGVLRPAFQLAVDDDLIRKNPFGFELASVIVNDSVTREAITRKQERDLLKFIKESGDQFCFVPGSCKTDHNGEYKCTHNGHDLWNGKFEYDFRKCLKPFYISNNGKMWDKYISCTCGKKSCTDRRYISDHKSNTQHTGGVVAELCDRWCNKPDDDQWYTEVDQLTENIFHCNNDIQNCNSQRSTVRFV